MVHQNRTTAKEGLHADMIAREGDCYKRNIDKSRFVFGVARQADRIRHRNEENTIAATPTVRRSRHTSTHATMQKTAAVPFVTVLLFSFRFPF